MTEKIEPIKFEIVSDQYGIHLTATLSNGEQMRYGNKFKNKLGAKMKLTYWSKRYNLKVNGEIAE